MRNIIGAITGTLTRPQLLLLSRHDPHGHLHAIGRTAPQRPEAARLVGGNVTAADPGHPWTGLRFASAWGSRDILDVTLVRPELVAEISAETAVDRGVFTVTRCASSGCAWTSRSTMFPG